MVGRRGPFAGYSLDLYPCPIATLISPSLHLMLMAPLPVTQCDTGGWLHQSDRAVHHYGDLADSVLVGRLPGFT